MRKVIDGTTYWFRKEKARNLRTGDVIMISFGIGKPSPKSCDRVTQHDDTKTTEVLFYAPFGRRPRVRFDYGVTVALVTAWKGPPKGRAQQTRGGANAQA